MGVNVELLGLDSIKATFKDLTPEIAKSVRKQINAGALSIKRSAIKDIQKATYGRVYRKGKGDGVSTKIHIASTKGNSPNTDTGHLWKNIVVSTGTGIITKEYFALVRSRAKYSNWLEDGTTKMAARPFMKPALNKNKDRIMKRIVQAVNGTLPKPKKRPKKT